MEAKGKFKLLRYAMSKRKGSWWQCYLWRGHFNRLGCELKKNQEIYRKSNIINHGKHSS